jgi:uncharacterized protein (TIGR00255 family)
MISSMTGYGRGELSKNRLTAAAEVRSVNSRYFEVNVRLPGTLAHREIEVREIVRKKFARGKLNVSISISRAGEDDLPLKVNVPAAKAYHKLLKSLSKAVDLKEKVTLEHLLKFPEILEGNGADASDDSEWTLGRKALEAALEETGRMRDREGKELQKDLAARMKSISKELTAVEKLSAGKVEAERRRLQDRVGELLADRSLIDERRLEMEIALIADRLDVTEEIVRFRSHLVFYNQAMDGDEPAGRKLNFLVQEINREANTIGSKSSDAEIARRVVNIKEELEKIREQLQNIE